MYNPASPQHSINKSGSVTPTSIPASPIGAFSPAPMLPDGLTLPYGQSAVHFSPSLSGGIASMNRPGITLENQAGYFVSQPQGLDQRFQQPQIIVTNGQHMMNPG